MTAFANIVERIWAMTCELAPWLLLGFFFAGLLSIFLKPETVRKWLGHGGFWSTIKASLVGVPIPLCSCGVIPVAASLRRHGASKPATAAFLASTPQTGVDSIAVTWSLLGPAFAVTRVIVAFVSGVVSGLFVRWVDRSPDPVTVPTAESSDPTSGNPWLAALHYGFIKLPRDIAKSLALGILLAAMLGALLPGDFLAKHIGSGWTAYLLITAVAIPLYVCSTGSIPFAFALMQAGLTPGAALVFLVAGPAVNVATITTMAQFLGKRAAVVHVAALVLVSWTAGWLFDRLALGPAGESHFHDHGMAPAWWSHAAAVVLLIIIGLALWPQREKKKSCCAAEPQTPAETPKACCCGAVEESTSGR